MAWTARNDEETTEYFDDEETLDWKVTALAQLIRSSKHFTVFTGAGISTSAGIPDFRSGLNTVLDTGAGKWALDAAAKDGKDVTPKKPLVRKKTLCAIPTPTHMALVQLNNRNILKYLISQNCDGLHRRSGYNPANLSELHGNTNLEFCRNCDKQYLRDYSVRNRYNHPHIHQTLRRCTNKIDNKACNNLLEDTIINFGENLNDYAWDPAEANAEKSDFCLVLGSSLTVSPACNLPEIAGNNIDASFAIVNLQKTPMDKLCDIRIYAKCDDVMTLLLNKLGYKIPEWRLKRYINIEVDFDDTAPYVSVFGVDFDGTPYDILAMIKLKVNKKVYTKSGACLHGKVFEGANLESVDDEHDVMRIELGFMRRYNEPDLCIDLMKYLVRTAGKVRKKQKFRLNLIYNPYNGIWQVSKDEKFDDDMDDNSMLVFGYLRRENMQISMTSNIKHLCYKYWQPMDIWDNKYIISSRLSVERYCDLIIKSDGMTSVFGRNIAFKNLRYVWKLRVKLFVNNGTKKRRAIMVVGVVPNVSSKIKLLKFSVDWKQEQDENFVPYWCDLVKNGVKNGDLIGIYLDLMNDRIMIVINGISSVDRMFKDINKRNYRLAIAFKNCKGTHVEMF